jgi:hypothetical protein
VREAVQTEVSSQLSSATTLFYKRNYLQAGEIARNILESYPSNMVLPMLWSKTASLKDRVRRADMISDCDSTALKLTSEAAFENSYAADFPVSAVGMMDSELLSPDGRYLVSRKKSSTGKYYLYLGKVLSNSDSVTFQLLPQTFDAENPAWSPDSRSLLYERTVKKYRKLEKTQLDQNVTRTLFYTKLIKQPNLGFCPAFHPSGNKIAFVYEGNLCVMDADGSNVNRLKTKQKFDYTSVLSWSFDGTMIRCKQDGKNSVDDMIFLDVFPTLP